MHPLRKVLGCLLYAILAVFIVCYVVYTTYGENVIRKLLHHNWDQSIKDEELETYHERREL